MLHNYVCEKCGQSFNTWDECYACENGHITTFSSLLEPETQKRMKYRPGCAAPEQLILATDHYYLEKSKSVLDPVLWEYKLVRAVPEREAKEIFAEYKKRQEEEDAWLADYRARKEREKAEQDQATA